MSISSSLQLGDRTLKILTDAPVSSSIGSTGLFWLGGYRSDMAGSKAEYLSQYAQQKNIYFTRFDYSGHGTSSSSMDEGTISRWLEEALAVFDTTTGPQIIIGSSMGGWLSILLNQTLLAQNAHRVQAMILIAPALDMTHALMWNVFDETQKAQLDTLGYVETPTEYAPEPYRITKKLIEDGKNHLMLDQPIRTQCPVHILHGLKDVDVPFAHVQKLINILLEDPVVLSTVPDGDHRLSRPQDLALLTKHVDDLLV